MKKPEDDAGHTKAGKDELLRLNDWITKNLDHLPHDFLALPLNHDLIIEILSKERIRIVRYLREHGPVDSLQELAAALGRDRSAVSRDLNLLEHRLVEVQKSGRHKSIRALERPILIY